MTNQSPKAQARFKYVMKSNISETSESILRALFNALFVADRHGIKIDHSPSNTAVMTLDIYQIQQMIRNHCDTLYTQMDIIDALFGLASPQLCHSPATRMFISELDGKRLDAVRLDYSNEPLADTLVSLGKNIADSMKKVSQSAARLYVPAVQISQSDTKLQPTLACRDFKLPIPKLDNSQHIDPDEFDMIEKHNKELEVSSNHFKAAAEQWRSNAFENQENYETAQATITALRSTIMELTETLQAADCEARVSLTSRELLQIINTSSDSSNVAF